MIAFALLTLWLRSRDQVVGMGTLAVLLGVVWSFPPGLLVRIDG